MKLPWFTINKDHIYSTIGDPKAAMDDRALKEMQKRSKVRKEKRIITPPAVLISNKDEHEVIINGKLLSFSVEPKGCRKALKPAGILNRQNNFITTAK